MGVEGFMLNEHHNAPFCMQAKCNIFASILAAVTKKAKIVLLGNPLPLAENPVRLAEELAMIDMISKGRLVSGFVRGGGQEQLANGVNPAYNRERFEEAHDLVVAAWTRQGPFRWEGTHYQHRVVNPWAVPLQKPYPRVWIPGVLSQETIIWAAKQRYPYIALNTSIEATKKIWKLYDKVALETGYEAGPREPRLPAAGACLRQRGEGREERPPVPVDAGRVHRPGASGVGEPVGLFLARRCAATLSSSRSAGRRTRAAGRPSSSRSPTAASSSARRRRSSPNCAASSKRPGPSIYGIWGNDGTVSNEDARTCIRLLGQEVMPAMREIGKELGLTDPFEADAPVHLQILDRPQADAAGRGVAFSPPASAGPRVRPG